MRGVVLSLGLIACATSADAFERLSPDAFLDLADGKTLTFSATTDGSVVGVEQFLNRRLSVWRNRDGRCVYGVITVEDTQLCFFYEELKQTRDCWWMYRDGDDLYARIADFSSSEIQQVTDISEDGVSCPTIPSV